MLNRFFSILFPNNTPTVSTPAIEPASPNRESTSDVPPILDLPNETLSYIALKLSPANIYKLSATSKVMQEFATSNYIFQKKLALHFNIYNENDNASLFKKKYLEQYKHLTQEQKEWHSLLKESDFTRINELELRVEDIIPALTIYNENCLLNRLRDNQAARDFLFEKICLQCFDNKLSYNEKFNGYTLLHFIGMLGPSSDLIFRLLPEFDATRSSTDKDGKTPLFHALERKLMQTCELFHTYHADPFQGSGFNKDCMPIYYAAKNNHVDYLMLLKKIDGIDVDKALHRNEFTPLYIAAQRNHLAAATVLLDLRAKPNHQCSSGSTPLYIAAQEGHCDMVKLLYLRGAAPSLNLVFRGGFTPLYVASRNGHDQIVDFLTQKGARIDANDGDGSTPLYVACQNGHGKVASILLKAGARVDSAFLGGYTPLYIAAQNGHTQIVIDLIAHNAQVNRVSPNGSAPLYVASQNGHHDAVLKLLMADASAEPSYSKDYTPLYVAAQKGHLKVLQNLLPFINNINNKTERGATAIYVACQHGHVSVVSFLLANKADPCIQFENGYTALHIACIEGYNSIIKLLIEAHPELLDIKDKNGKTAADLCSANQPISQYLNSAKKPDLQGKEKVTQISTDSTNEANDDNPRPHKRMRGSF